MNFLNIFLLFKKLVLRGIKRNSSLLETNDFIPRLKKMLGDFSNYRNCNALNTKEIISLAEKYLNDTYDILGSGSIKVNDKWNVDFKTNYHWAKKRHYLRYKIIDYDTQSDIKFPWEMSRCHHLLILGQAFLLTKDEKYAEKIKNDITSWIADNPFMYSVNWTCSMEVAIRAVNWIYAINMISYSCSIDYQFITIVKESFFQHKYFIEHNLEKGYPYSGNHYIANLCGLIVLSLLFGKKNTNDNYIYTEYFNEIRSQILVSGFHFEKCTSYHRLVLEMLLYTNIIINRCGVHIPPDIHQKLKAMVRFLDNIIEEDGSIQLIGDNDDGRFLPFMISGLKDLRYLISVAKETYNFKDLNNCSPTFVPELFFLIGKTECETNIYTTKTEKKINFYEDASFCIMSDKCLKAIIHNNPMSRYVHGNENNLYSSHTHSDILSFTLSCKKYKLILDPGTFCYTSSPALRNKFRSTKMHNTVCVNDLNQQASNINNLFSLTQHSFPTQTVILDDKFIGEYEHVTNGEMLYSHRRCVYMSGMAFTIEDYVFNPIKGDIVAYYHLSNDAIISISGSLVNVKQNGLSWQLSFFSSYDYLLVADDCEISPSYGLRVQAPVIKLSFTGNPKTIIFKTEIKILM